MRTVQFRRKTAPCQEACPAGVDVPRYIRLAREGMFNQALAVIRESIPFPGICGYACAHPCEGKCSRAQYDQALAIRMLKRAIVENADCALEYSSRASFSTGKKISIVGSGPCGLTAAYYLAGMGHKVIIYEEMHEAGGMLRYGIPGYRLPREVLKKEIAMVISRGVEIKTGINVSLPKKLLNECDAVLAATGACAGAGINLVNQGMRVLEGTSFLKNINSGKHVSLGDSVVVVGGGSTAIDAARSLIRLGVKEVVLVYRRTRTEMPAEPEEVADALEEGVRMEFLSLPVKARPDFATMVRTRLDSPDASGRLKPVPVKGSEYDIKCDTIIIAAGQSADASVMGLDANSDGTVAVNGFATNTDGIFAAGDLATGPSSIIKAIAQGKEAARAVDEYLGGCGDICEKFTDADVKAPDFLHAVISRPSRRLIEYSKRIKTFNLVEKGYNRHTARKEANRCLGCDVNQYVVNVDFNSCKACGYCKEVCGLGVFSKSKTFNERGYQPMVIAGDYTCSGCQKCFFVCPDFSISISKVGEAG